MCIRDSRKLTPEAIASAAVDLADREGLEGLTMRSLARHLGVEAMSLYHHFVGKDALLDAMVDRVYAGIDLPTPDGDSVSYTHLDVYKRQT